MADAPKLQPSDRSVEAYEKINQSIDHANEAKNESNEADATANEAKQISNDAKQIASESNQKSDSTQDQLDQVVIDGDSSAEAAQARVRDVNGETTTFDTLKGRADDTDTQLAEKTYYADTVSDMYSKAYPVGSVIKTLGYYNIGDGGGNLYTTIQNSLKNYDIDGNGIAFRPIVNGTIHPKMFGTLNDGTSNDNTGLQKCYDYSFDMGIETIDGLGLTYIIGTENEIDEEERGWAHTGAAVRAGRKLTNFKFKTADGATNGTCPLVVMMDDNDKPIYLENIEVDGNRLNATQLDTFDGREDGGLHGILFIHENPVLSPFKDFSPCGNIYMKNVKVIKPLSYGVRIECLDCKVTLEDCDFDVHGIAVQAHSTLFEVNGGSVISNTPRSGLVGDAFHTEIEFASNYQGDKSLSIRINDVDLINVGHTPRLYKLHYSPMQNVKIDEFKISDCDVNGNHLVEIYNSTESISEIENITINNVKNAMQLIRLNCEVADKISVNEVKATNSTEGVFILLKTKINKLVVSDFVMKGNFINSVSSTISELIINNSKAKELHETYGILRDAGTLIELLKVSNCEIWQNSTRLFEASFNKIEVDKLIINPDPTTGKHYTPFVVRETKTTNAETIANNVLLTGSEYNSYERFIIYDSSIQGFMYLNNVKHQQNSTLKTQGLTASDIVLVNCEPLFTSA